MNSKRFHKQMTRRFRSAVVCVAVLVGASCGAEVHPLDDVADPLTGAAIPPAALTSTLRGFDGDKALQTMIAGDRSTIFMITGEPCEGCPSGVEALMKDAFTEPQFSVIVIGFPVVPKDTADKAVSLGATIFGVPDPDPVRAAFAVSAYPTFVVVTPEAKVRGTFAGSNAYVQAIESARGQ